MIPRRQHIDWIKYLIETEGFVVRDFLLTAPRVRPPKRERRRRQIAEILYRSGLSAHDLVTPAAPTSESGLLLFIARFENGHETCTAVLGVPDKRTLQRGIQLAQRAFTSLMHAQPPRILAARFEINNVVVRHFDADEIAKAITDSNIPSSPGADGGKLQRADRTRS